MSTLIVLAHPNPQSLTHALATQVAEAIREIDPQHVVELADLAAEGFQPAYTNDDLAITADNDFLPPGIAEEQARIEPADQLVLVFPIYWWSFPALLKGWIDRVFTIGWAYDYNEQGIIKKLKNLRVHLLAVGAGDLGTYQRRGYDNAIQKQIDEGIFDYCGAQVISSDLLLLADARPEQLLERARARGVEIAQFAVERDEASA